MMDSAILVWAVTTQSFWVRYGIVLVLAIVVCCKMRTSLVVCTASGVCIAGLSASFFENEQFATLILLAGLTLGPLVGFVADTFMTHERRTQNAIKRRYAREYVRPTAHERKGFKLKSNAIFGFDHMRLTFG